MCHIFHDFLLHKLVFKFTKAYLAMTKSDKWYAILPLQATSTTDKTARAIVYKTDFVSA